MSNVRINSGKIGYAADLMTPQGKTMAILNEAEKDAYQSDPDGFAARYFGLEPAEYQEWMRVKGAPLCASTTQEGGPCGNMVASSTVDPQTWKDLHRRARCHMHTYGHGKRR